MPLRVEEFNDLTAQVNRREMDVMEAARITVASGYLIVGTADLTRDVIEPSYAGTYDLELLRWAPYPSDSADKVARATDLPIAGVLCALVGDYNYGGPVTERANLNGDCSPLTDLPRPHFSWNHTSTEFYAVPEVINEARRRGRRLQGILAIIEHDESFQPTAGEIGHYYSSRAHRVVGRLPVDGTDFPFTVQPCSYVFPQVEQGSA